MKKALIRTGHYNIEIDFLDTHTAKVIYSRLPIIGSINFWGNEVYFYTDLKINVSTYINQIAFNILLYEEDDKKIKFNISNNDGASSSIYSFGSESEKDHLEMINSVNLISKKIDTFFLEQLFKVEDYDFWVMDIQGAELSALKGAKKSLEKCNFIYVEISTGDYYRNASQWVEIKSFLKKFNFENLWEPASSHTDVLFKKII